MGMWAMSLDSWYCSEQLLCIDHFNPNYGIKDITFTDSRVITGQPNRRGTDPFLVCWMGVVDQQTAYPGSLYSADQLCCSKYFGPANGLF